MNRNTCNLLFACFLYLTSCNTSLSPEKYSEWATSLESGLSKTLSSEGYDYNIKYEPLPLVALKRNGSDIEKEELDKFLSDAKGTHYFLMEVSVTTGEDLITYQAISHAEMQRKIHYFAYRLQGDISFRMGKETFPCDIFHFERSFDLKPSRTFVIGFNSNETDSSDNPITLIIDSVLLNEEPIEIEFEISDLPKLAI